MSFENGVFLPDPLLAMPPEECTRGRRGGSTRSNASGGHHYRGQRQHSSRSPRSIPSLMDQQGGVITPQHHDNAVSFNFNPNAPAFQPLLASQSNNQYLEPQQQSYNRTSQSRPGLHRNLRGRGDGQRKENWNRRRAVNNANCGSSDEEGDAGVSQEPENTRSPVKDMHKPDIRNQRERLNDQLARNAYDCMICVERVRRGAPIWACSKCFNVFHLRCVSTWANSSKDEVGWRCPGCQSYYEDVPSEYRCFCGKVKNPENVRSDVPHGCGQLCGKTGSGGPDCQHHCPLLCHPGPCPLCEAIHSRKCCCGKTTAQVKCSSKSILTCRNICDKLLNCGVHKCTTSCHAGACEPCAFVIELECHCNSEKMETVCSPTTKGMLSFSCGRPCDKLLTCKSHKCPECCHVGSCKPCKLSPEIVLSCPCGQTSVNDACLKCRIPQRKKCLDPIPVCGKICGKSLMCGTAGISHHKCSSLCHIAPNCPTCPLVTSVKCRCGSKTFEFSCAQYDPLKEYRCEKRCSKKKSCGRHKCSAKCCVDLDHICLIVCDRPLRCGNHNCSFLCHNGHCAPCRVSSFHELACECGASIIYPPVPCGTSRPPCTVPCGREHDCDHPVLHHCHSDPQCPPCTMLTEKWCHGKHMLRKNVMCHIKQLSCGMQCKRKLPCGRHECTRSCHADDCLAAGKRCQLACGKAMAECGHGCVRECHDGPCPEIKCKVVSEVSCPCGRRQETMACWKRGLEYERLVCYLTNLELKRLRELSEEEETKIDAEVILSEVQTKTPKAHVLECDKECARVERNRKMMEALQLEDPDATSTFGTPNYCEFLISFAKKNPQFVENVHDRLTNLVVKAKRSKRKNETFGFESMNRDKRRVVHEYSDHFGCLSESFDEEPNRNVVCTASKDKSYLPAVSLVDAVFRPNMCSGRKNAFNDVEIFQNTKSQIMRPANGRIMSSIPSATSRGMVPLLPPTTTITTPNFHFSSHAISTQHFTPSTTVADTFLPTLPGADFPPLS